MKNKNVVITRIKKRVDFRGIGIIILTVLLGIIKLIYEQDSMVDIDDKPKKRMR